ncbi:hypothetical protein [Psychrobacillus sp.]|uniref:hemoblobin-interacting domain-containing protein n=1 Tax=Psychrobacillus sp. TaxID=1871623 RepID=UPI0028BD63F3|nr:hypothetical protein [Psychrobacillus sp.]
MKRKLWKEIAVAILLVSTILSFSPIAYGETTSVQQSIDNVTMEMKKAALSYVEPALKGELVLSSSLDSVLNSVKKNYQETRKIILASNLSEKEKQAKLKEIDALYDGKIVKGLIPYIDAYNYASKYLEPLLKEITEAEAKNDFLAVEKAYHELSVQLKSRTSILYRLTGKAPRHLLLEMYKKPADAKRDELVIPVTIMMKAASAQQLLLAGKKEEAIKATEDIPSLVAKLSNTNSFHQALIKELERLQAILLPAPVVPEVPTPPVTSPSTGSGGNDGLSETSAQRALRLAKTDAIKELTDYKSETDYSVVNWTTILSLKTTWRNAINSAKTTTEVTQVLDNAKAEVDKVLTIAQEMALALDKAKTDAIAELAIYKDTDYSPTNWTSIKGYKVDGTFEINAATTTAAVVKALSYAQMKINAVKTLVEEQQDQQNQDLVNTEAANIPLTFAPAANLAGTVSLPTVGADYTISVKSTSNPLKYGMDGKVKADGSSTVVYTVTHKASGKTADTGLVEVITTIILKVPPVVNTVSPLPSTMPFNTPIEFTFIDDPEWRAAFESLGLKNQIGSTIFFKGRIVINDGTLKLANGFYGVSLTWVWTFKATGYQDVIITLEVLPKLP